jgi:hypothetical protein
MNEGPGAIPKDGSAHPAPHTRKRHRHYANVPETAEARFCSARPWRRCPEWAMKSERSPQRGTPAAKTAGVRRRVIEGEGLGGFARRLYSIRVLLGGSGLLHNFFRCHARGSGPASRPFVPGRMGAQSWRLAEIRRNIDPLSARQHHIARNHAQIPIFPAATFDHISGADGKTLGQRTGLTVNWQTHSTLSLTSPLEPEI